MHRVFEQWQQQKKKNERNEKKNGETYIGKSLYVL
jgi:hypothetical protein